VSACARNRVPGCDDEERRPRISALTASEKEISMTLAHTDSEQRLPWPASLFALNPLAIAYFDYTIDATQRSLIFLDTLRPSVTLSFNEQGGDLARAMHPLRLQYTLCSDLNPLMASVRYWADLARQYRLPRSADNPLVKVEQNVGAGIENTLTCYRDLRDGMAASWFRWMYGPAALGALFPPEERSSDYRSPAMPEYAPIPPAPLPAWVEATPPAAPSPAPVAPAVERPDPLIEIVGIGPVYQQRLYAAGVKTFAALAALTVEQIRAILGARLSTDEAIAEWIRQASSRVPDRSA
jgi:predicted flap endonuclease-1-like 5' DNA nuclease